MQYFDILKASCEDINVDFDENKYNQLIQYKNLLQEWNEKINLTSITEDEEIIKKHFIDSIKIYKFSPLKDMKRIIDVGTGAGFPGLPIKIVDEKKQVVLLDSLNKRINFLNEVINTLKLENIETVHGRAEDVAKDKGYRESFDGVVSRAVANMSVLSEFCLPFVKLNGYFIAMKGPAVEEEIKEAKNAIGTLGGKIEDIIGIDIEESDLRHNLVIIKKVKETPGKYPRKAGLVTKSPLR